MFIFNRNTPENYYESLKAVQDEINYCIRFNLVELFDFDKITNISHWTAGFNYPIIPNEIIKEWQSEIDLHIYLSYVCEALELDYKTLDKELIDIINHIDANKDAYLKVMIGSYSYEYLDCISFYKTNSGKMCYAKAFLRIALKRIENKEFERYLTKKLKINNSEILLNMSFLLNDILSMYFHDTIQDLSPMIWSICNTKYDLFTLYDEKDQEILLEFTSTWMYYYKNIINECTKPIVVDFLNRWFPKIFSCFRYDAFVSEEVNCSFYTDSSFHFLIAVIKSDFISKVDKDKCIKLYINELEDTTSEVRLKRKFKQALISLDYNLDNNVIEDDVSLC